MVRPMPYVAVQQLLDPPNPKGMQNYWTADFFAELPDEAVDTLVDRATKPVSPMTQIILVPGGGAIARVDEDATAFGQRTAPWNIHYLSMWEDAAATEGAGRVEAGVRAGHVRTAGRAQAAVGSDEPVPPQPEHLAGAAARRLMPIVSDAAMIGITVPARSVR